MNILYGLTSALLITVLGVASLNAQEIRAIDGSNNNLNHPEWGSVDAPLVQFTSVGFADQIAMPGGEGRPNPRAVSNALFSQDGVLADPLELSDFTWVFGQLIDHDVTFVLDGDEPFNILVPQGDRHFDPFGTGEVTINMHRSLHVEGSGTDRSNPRSFPNHITSFIDGSSVYGSDEARARWLRSFSGGKLKVSPGNLMPFNTVDGTFEGEIDHSAPEMDDPVGVSEKHFVAGDARANENPLLLSFHTIFVREHNRLCDELVKQYPDWSDEQLYQFARKLVGGIMQSIAYNEWLPTMGVDLPEYRGYNPTVNPGMTNVFSAAAFRLGHTLLNANMLRLDAEGNPLEGGPIALRDAFFNPLLVYEDGLDPYFQGMAAQVQQSMDSKVVDDVRNFLFGPPGAGGLDLAAINIQRGRERGLPDFNTVRENFGLPAYVFFIQLNSNPEIFTEIQRLYRQMNQIDPWVGMLSEARMPGALFGQTIMTIMKHQFLVLRDGDRFYFENDDAIPEEWKQYIQATRMVNVIKNNTNISLMQENVFKAELPQNICVTSDIRGIIHTENHTTINDLVIELIDHDEDTLMLTGTTNGEGIFEFVELDGCKSFDVKVTSTASDWLNGVSTLDMLLIQKHILGVEPLDSPYKIIAADANGSGTITTSDVLDIRRVILGMQPSFGVGSSWRFVDEDLQFSDPNNPFTEAIDIITVEAIDERALDIVAIKVGDLNSSVTIANRTLENRSILPLNVEQTKADGRSYLTLELPESMDIEGLQLALTYDASKVQLLDLQYGNLPDLSAANFFHSKEQTSIAMSWNTTQAIGTDRSFVTLAFEADPAVNLLDYVQLDNSRLQAELYASNVYSLTLSAAEGAVELAQNDPNPFSDYTNIRFALPEAGMAKISIFDVTGKQVHAVERYFEAGWNQVQINAADLDNFSGVAYYSLESGDTIISKKMVIVSK